MKIQSIEFKNIASYGNKIQKIEFSNEKAELYLTLGKNGDGKTTIANAIIFALYGKVEGVRLTDLPNRINKDMWVRIKLQCGTMNLEIERGLAPTKFSVLINGVEFDKAGKRSVQEYLEEEVYGIPYHVFKNIIILSINDFKSFLTMSPSDKKQIIDKMFGFSILNDMQRAVKEERKNIKSDIDSYESELKQIDESIVQVKMKLNQLQAQSDEKSKGEIEKLKQQLIKFDENKTKLEEAGTKIRETIGKFEEDLDTKSDKYNTMRYELDSLKKKLALYENNTCPTCEAPLDSEFHVHKKTEYQDKVEAMPDVMAKAEQAVNGIRNKISETRLKERAVLEKVSSLNASIRALKGELVKIKEKSVAGGEFDHLNELIRQFEEQETTKNQEKSKYSNDYHFLELVEDILGEDGVKNLAVKTILPGLNTNIAAMANTMHLSFHIRFDDKFNCIITHLGEEVNPMTLSTGERKKADFIIIIAIIKILKLRFPQLNLLFLDELLSSVDQDGVYNILKILSQVIKENQINTFVINHTVLPHEIFDKKLQIYRDNGFSKFEIETIE
jgi:DNA repair exonuclease SbcCD ATPase subunit